MSTDLEASRTDRQFRDRGRRDLWRTAAILAALWLIWQVGTSERALGAPVAEGGGSAARSTPAPAHHTGIWLTEGSTGSQVGEVQRILSHYGYYAPVDEMFGPVTRQAVTSFQRSSGLLADGIVGPVTWGALSSVAPASRLDNATRVTPTLIPDGINGDCATWEPMVVGRYGLPRDFLHEVGWRESRCDGYAYNWNPRTRDASYGIFQVNRYTDALQRWWDSGGFTVEVMRTPEGAIAAAATLYHACGPRPWIKPYGCDDYQQVPSPTWAEWQAGATR